MAITWTVAPTCPEEGFKEIIVVSALTWDKGVNVATTDVKITKTMVKGLIFVINGCKGCHPVPSGCEIF
ncbi:MAG: hypothetical protein N0A00_09415 [Candidatus Bathyarchaeota archaeon]|nr:hypothetical protein [Candidatus Bathyarchaeota archaeon]